MSMPVEERASVSCSVLFSPLIADTMLILQNPAFQFSGIVEAIVKYPNAACVLFKRHDVLNVWVALLEFVSLLSFKA